MANNSFILGNLATSGSVVVNNKILFSTFESASNFEVPDFVASASFEINTVNFEITSNDWTVVDSTPTSSFYTLTYDYSLHYPSQGGRTGQFLIIQDTDVSGVAISFTDTSTKEIGNAGGNHPIDVRINSGNTEIRVSGSAGYIFKAFVKKF